MMVMTPAENNHKEIWQSQNNAVNLQANMSEGNELWL